VKAHVEEDRTGSSLTYVEKKVQVLVQFTKSAAGNSKKNTHFQKNYIWSTRFSNKQTRSIKESITHWSRYRLSDVSPGFAHWNARNRLLNGSGVKLLFSYMLPEELQFLQVTIRSMLVDDNGEPTLILRILSLSDPVTVTDDVACSSAPSHFQLTDLMSLTGSFFLSWVSKIQPNHWTKRMVNTRLTT